MVGGPGVTMVLIETRSNAEPIGFVFAYDYNPFDKYVFWSIALHPAYTNIGWGAEASVLFWNYLFTYFDLHKICSEHFTFNERSIKLLRRFGAREEGRFKAQRYYQGAYHDVVRLAGTRAEWDRVKQRAIRLFAPRPGRATQADAAPVPPATEQAPAFTAATSAAGNAVNGTSD